MLMRDGYFREGGVGGFSFDSKSFEKTQKVWIMLFKGARGSAGCWSMVTKVGFLVNYRYEQQLKERESQLQKEDLGDMFAEHASKQKVPFH